MAINVMTLVWEHAPFKGGTLLLLLALADHAHKDGSNVYPGVPTLAQDSRMTERQVRRCLKELECSGIIVKVSAATGRPGWKNEYRIDLETLKKCQGGKNVRPDKEDDEGGHSAQKGRTITPAHIEEPSFEPSENRHPLSPVGSSENIPSLGQGEGRRFPEFRSAIADTWPDAFPKDDEGKARAAFERLTRRISAGTLIACARQHGAALMARKARRGDAPGAMLVKRPSNWLKEGGWEGYVGEVDEAVDREAALALALARVQTALGPGLMEILRNLELPPHSIAALDGMTFAEGPPRTLAGSSHQRSILERYGFALRRKLGEDLQIVVMAGTERKSA